MADTASSLGNAMDELMRHQPSVRTDAIKAIIQLLENIRTLGTNPQYVAQKSSSHAGRLGGAAAVAGAVAEGAAALLAGRGATANNVRSSGSTHHARGKAVHFLWVTGRELSLFSFKGFLIFLTCIIGPPGT